jgi:hypothetical protein
MKGEPGREEERSERERGSKPIHPPIPGAMPPHTHTHYHQVTSLPKKDPHTHTHTLTQFTKKERKKEPP